MLGHRFIPRNAKLGETRLRRSAALGFCWNPPTSEVLTQQEWSGRGESPGGERPALTTRVSAQRTGSSSREVTPRFAAQNPSCQQGLRSLGTQH